MNNKHVNLLSPPKESIPLNIDNDYETSPLQGQTRTKLYPDLGTVDVISESEIHPPPVNTVFTPQSYITSLGHKKLFHVDVYFGNTLVKALIDTGASFSLISAATAQRLAIPPQDIQTTGDKALDASDTSMKFLGIIDLPFKIGQAMRHGTFRIWDNTTHEMILGQEFYSVKFTGHFYSGQSNFSLWDTTTTI